jgi:uncharacterized protein (DUF1778 family)
VAEKKPKVVKDEVVRMRIPAEQKAAMVSAAEADGLDLSTWLRRLALREVGLLPRAKPGR